MAVLLQTCDGEGECIMPTNSESEGLLSLVEATRVIFSLERMTLNQRSLADLSGLSIGRLTRRCMSGQPIRLKAVGLTVEKTYLQIDLIGVTRGFQPAEMWAM